MTYKNLIFTLLIFLFSLQCFAEQEDRSKNSENKTEYLVLPFGYYTEATSLGFGIYSIFLFKENKNGDRSKLRSDLSYTLNSQIIFRFKSLFYLTGSKLSLKTNVMKFKSNYYSLNNNSEIDNEPFSYFSTDLNLDYIRKLNKHVSYSLIYDLDVLKITSFKEGGMLENNGFNYDGLKFNHGIGAGLNFGNVTKNFFREGLTTEVKYLISSEFFGSDNNFSVLGSVIEYFSSYKQSSINLQFVSRFSFDNIPLMKLSTLGGTYNLRGYPDKRFSDSNMLLFQSEYDFRIYKKIAGSVFYSFGDVFDPFSDLKFNKIKQGYGIGLLYDLLGTAIRFDVATSPENEIQIIATGSRAF